MFHKYFSRIFALLIVLELVMPSFVVAASESKNLPERELVIAMAISGRDEDAALVDEAMSRITKEKINATVKTLYIPMASWKQQINVMLASGEQIDIAMSGSIHGFATNTGKGQFLPLDDLLQEYGQNILAALNDTLLQCGSVNGQIYGVASLRDLATAPCILMRKDVLEEHGIDISEVTTFEDLTPIFEAVKQAEPDMIPLVAKFTDRSIVEWMTRGLLDELGCVSDHFGTLELGSGEYELTPYYETELYKELVELVRSWYMAGYISNDAATTTDIGYNTVKAGKAFSYFMAYKPGVDTQESRFCGTEMVCIQLAEATQSIDQVTGYLTTIPVTTVDAERAMMLLDLFYSDPDLINLWVNGIEGRHYDYTDETRTVIYTDESHSTAFPSINYMLGNAFLTPVWEGEAVDLWEQMKTFNDTAFQSDVMSFAFNTDMVTAEIAAVSNVKNEFSRGIGCGVLDPDEYYNVFIDKMIAAGYHDIVDEEQAQLDQWVAENVVQ